VISPTQRDLYLTTHNPLKRQTTMPQVGFETTISASERPQTHALDGAATGTGSLSLSLSLSIYIYIHTHTHTQFTVSAHLYILFLGS
jgi:hypothetical protein